jgi:hypothetical protein
MNQLDVASMTRLHQCWASRYLPDLALLPSQRTHSFRQQLIAATSEVGRQRTVAQVRQELPLTCEWAVIKTTAVFSSDNILSLTDTKSLAVTVAQAYEKVLEVYQDLQFPSDFADLIFRAHDKTPLLSALTVPFLEQLNNALAPILQRLRDRLLATPDAQAFGFTTTYFHFCSQRILDRLSLCDRILLKPYLQFVEEQVCIPWQRLCSAAARYKPDSPIFLLVEQSLAVSTDISESVYQRAVQLFPNYRSRQGNLNQPQLASSSIRDLNMFQGYLWLCVLERDMTAIEQHLLPLCVTVFPKLGVPWTFVKQGMQMLVEAIFSRLTAEQCKLLRPYTHSLKWMFATPLYDRIIDDHGVFSRRGSELRG